MALKRCNLMLEQLAHNLPAQLSIPSISLLDNIMAGSLHGIKAQELIIFSALKGQGMCGDLHGHRHRYSKGGMVH